MDNSLQPGYEFVDGKPVLWLREGREVRTLAGQTGFISQIAKDGKTVMVDINGEEVIEQVNDIQPIYEGRLLTDG